MTTRRHFMQQILAAGVAPAFVGAHVLMPVRRVLLPSDFMRGELGVMRNVDLIINPPLIAAGNLLDAQDVATAGRVFYAPPSVYKELKLVPEDWPT